MLRRPLLSLACSFTLTAGCSLGGCSPAFFRQPAGESRPPATAEEIAALHPPDALRAELDALVALHERACPDPYLRADAADIAAIRDRLKASIARPMTRREFLPLVMEMQAAYRIDHMAMSVPLEDIVASIKGGERVLPFRVDLGQGAMRVIAVADAEHGLEPGDVVVRIGEESAAEVTARLRRLVPGESDRFQAKRISDSFPAYAWAAGIIPPIEVEVLRGAGQRIVTRVDGVRSESRSTERRIGQAAATDVPDPLTSAEVLVQSEPFRCSLIQGDIAYIEFPSMSQELGERWQAFLVDALGAITARGCTGLIVDIRRNGGGDSQLGDLLLAHLTDRPYRMAGAVVWRRSEEGLDSMSRTVKPGWRWLIPVLTPAFAPEYSRLADGEDLTGEAEPAGPTRAEPFVDLPSVLLIGEGTFSSAMMLADAARTYDLMTTVGTPTGGLPTSLGELGFWQLPTSRFVVPFCQKKFMRASGDPKDTGPVVPHVLLESEGDLGSDRDEALRRAVEFLRTANSKRG